MALVSPFQIFMTAVFGLVVGSFVNVLIVRLPQKKSVVRPGSACPQCSTPLRWWENIPVLSYLFLGGKCRTCRKSISVRYPVVEILVAALFLACLFRFGWESLLWLRDWPFVAILVAITFIDLEHRIIPDTLSLTGLVVGLLSSFLIGAGMWKSAFWGAALGFSLFYLLSWVYLKMTRRMGLGGGDIKLLAMLGAYVGPFGVLSVILLSSVVGALVGLIWAAWSRKKGKEGEGILVTSIPYGPFLAIAGLYVYLIGENGWLPFMIPT